MKKIGFGLIATFTFFYLLSCSTESNIEKDNDINNSFSFKTTNYQLNDKITIKKTTSKVSQLFLNMGVVEVKVTEKENLTEYSFTTKKMFGINGEGTDFKDYRINLCDGIISISSNSDIKLTILENKPYIITPSYEGYLKPGEYIDDKNFNLLYLFMNELLTPESSKTDASNIDNVYSRGCSFGSTKYVFSTGFSRSVAEANLPDEIAHYTSGFNTLDLSGCRKFGGVDTTCGLGNHFCISTQAFCCN